MQHRNSFPIRHSPSGLPLLDTNITGCSNLCYQLGKMGQGALPVYYLCLGEYIQKVLNSKLVA